jgi:MFS family permease
MQSAGAVEATLSFPRGLTRYQWAVFLVVWAGWALDATDFGLFSLVLRPALTDLLGGNSSMADIGRIGGFLSMAGLLGWAFGGFMFGIIADYIGRVRTLAVSILIYSVFTALQGFSHSPLELGHLRFIGELGTGGEIIVGIPLVAEAFAQTYRAPVLGVMMTGGAFGSLIGGWVYGLVGPYGWRWVFFVGIAPAILLAFIPPRAWSSPSISSRFAPDADAPGERRCRQRRGARVPPLPTGPAFHPTEPLQYLRRGWPSSASAQHRHCHTRHREAARRRGCRNGLLPAGSEGSC